MKKNCHFVSNNIFKCGKTNCVLISYHNFSYHHLYTNVVIDILKKNTSWWKNSILIKIWYPDTKKTKQNAKKKSGWKPLPIIKHAAILNSTKKEQKTQFIASRW